MKRSGRGSERWDRWAPKYDRGLRARRFLRPLYDHLLAVAAPRAGERALDVGAGTGTLAAMVAASGARAFAADPSAGMAGVAAAKLPGRAVVAAAERLPFPDGSFDLVTTSMSLHHWRDARAGLAEAARVLAPGGRAVVADIEGRGILRRLAVTLAHLFARDEHRHHARHEIAEALRAGGLEVGSQRAWRYGVLVTVARRGDAAARAGDAAVPTDQ